MSYIDATDTSLRKTGQIKLHGPSGFAGMRKAGALVSKCLDALTDIVKPGVPTSEIDEFVRKFAFDHGAYPATLMYRGYRYSTCTSINHVVCHGMPGDRPLKEGDIVDLTPTVMSYLGIYEPHASDMDGKPLFDYNLNINLQDFEKVDKRNLAGYDLLFET